ncbi:MAG: transposase [candidate division NC10 bacterium]|nr:transposase [candidate division NC10 bacterium]
MTGLSVEEFDQLYNAVRQVYPASEDRRLARPTRRRQRGAGRKFRHDLRNRLLLALTWLRVCPSYRVLGVMFDWDKSNICRNLKAILPALQQVTDTALPELEPDLGNDDLDALVAAFPELRAIVDATEQRIRRPKNQEAQKAHDSGKKKAHTRKTQLVVNQAGRIAHVSDSVPGSMHDLTLERQSQLNEQVPSPSSLMGDKGYQGMQHDNPQRRIELPVRKP